MAKLTDELGKIKQSELDKFFSKYGDAGVLESAFTTSPNMNVAARNFNSNLRGPGMEEDPIPGAAPTDLSATQVRKLEPAPWLVSMQGEGPRNQQTPASFKSLLERQDMQQALRDRQQDQVNRFMKANPIEFAGVPEGVFENIAQAMKFYSIKAEKLKGGAGGSAKAEKLKGGAGGSAWKDVGASTDTTKGSVTPSTVVMIKDGKSFNVPSANVEKAKLRGYVLQ